MVAPKKGAKSRRKSKGKATKTSRSFAGAERVYAFADGLMEREAEEAQVSKPEERLETWVTFGLAGEVFAFPVSAMQEIIRVGMITRVPHAPYPVRGIINKRGRVVPVLDLRLRLGLPTTDVSPRSRILVTSSRNRVLGFLVDSVQHVVKLDRNAVEVPPSDVLTEQSEYIIGVYHLDDTLLILLDVERVLLIPDSLQQATHAHVER